MGLAVSPNGRNLASVDFDGQVRVTDLNSTQTIWEQSRRSNDTKNCSGSSGISVSPAIAFNPSGHLLASAYCEGDGQTWTIVLEDARTGRPHLRVKDHTAMVYGVAFDGVRWMYSWGADDGDFTYLPTVSISER